MHSPEPPRRYALGRPSDARVIQKNEKTYEAN